MSYRITPTVIALLLFVLVGCTVAPTPTPTPTPTPQYGGWKFVDGETPLVILRANGREADLVVTCDGEIYVDWLAGVLVGYPVMDWGSPNLAVWHPGQVPSTTMYPRTDEVKDMLLEILPKGGRLQAHTAQFDTIGFPQAIAQCR